MINLGNCNRLIRSGNWSSPLNRLNARQEAVIGFLLEKNNTLENKNALEDPTEDLNSKQNISTAFKQSSNAYIDSDFSIALKDFLSSDSSDKID